MNPEQVKEIEVRLEKAKPGIRIAMEVLSTTKWAQTKATDVIIANAELVNHAYTDLADLTADWRELQQYQEFVEAMKVAHQPELWDQTQQRITDLEAENRELREKYDGAVKECQRLTDLLAMRGE